MLQSRVSNIIYFNLVIENPLTISHLIMSYISFIIYSILCMEDRWTFYHVAHTPLESDTSNKGKKRPSAEHSHSELYVGSNDFPARSKTRWFSLLLLQPVVPVCGFMKEVIARALFIEEDREGKHMCK